MLDSLLYYAEFAHCKEEYVNIGKIIEEKGEFKYTSAINKMVPDDKNGMNEIVQRVANHDYLPELEIVSCSSSANMPQVNAVCLMDKEKNVYFLYGGNYAKGDYDYDDNDNTSETTWQSNFVGAVEVTTAEREYANDFYVQTMKKLNEDYGVGNYNNVILSGHSKGGNLAQCVTIRNGASVKACLSIDGQGMSEDFIKEYPNEIDLYGEKITSIMPTTSYVGTLMNQLDNATYIYVKPRIINEQEIEIQCLEGFLLGTNLTQTAYSHLPATLLTDKYKLRENLYWYRKWRQLLWYQ